MDGNGQPALPAEKKIGQFKARWCRNRFLQLGIARQIGTDNEIIAQGNLTAGLMHMANLHGQLAGDQHGTIITTDLTTEYVHENSAYST